MSHLKITILQGSTVDGQSEYEFPLSKETIVLGRDADHCDIVFNDELREQGLGNEHLALRRSLGRYQLDLNTENYVAVDGRPAFEEQEITNSAEIELDRGARVKVEIVQDRSETIAQRKPAAQPGRVAMRNRRLVAIFALVLIGVLGVVWYNTQRIGAIDTDVRKAQGITEATLDRITSSVYLVLVRNADGGESPVGTAWVAQSKEGRLLVTNAHVAEIHDELNDEQTMYVRSNVGPDYREHEVAERELHPGFRRFREITLSYEPIVEGAQGGAKRLNSIAAADVALLQVDNPGQLAEPLPLLPESAFIELATGQELAYVGYPTENMVGGTLSKPSPITHKDELIAVTDFFMVRRADDRGRLVQHALPVAGGASGSPVVDDEGRVIAVLSAGNVLAGEEGRMPLAVDVNFAQRVDFVYDLLRKRADEATERYAEQWRAGLEAFDSLPKMALQAAFEHITDALDTDTTPSPRTATGELQPAPQGEEPARVRHGLGTIGDSMILVRVLPDTAADIDIHLLAEGEVVAKDEAYNLSALIQYWARDERDYQLVVNAANRLAKDRAVPYSVELYQWPVDAAASSRLVARGLIAKVKNHLETEQDPELVLESSGRLSERSVPPVDFHLWRQDFTPSADGYFLILAYPSGRDADIDLLVTNRSGKLIAKDMEQRSQAFITRRMSQGTGLWLFAGHESIGDIPVEMRVYRW